MPKCYFTGRRAETGNTLVLAMNADNCRLETNL